MFRLLLFIGTPVIILFTSLHLLFPLPDQVDYSKVVVDRNGEIIHAFLSTDEKWRLKTSLEEISPLLRKTIIEKEDRFFLYHSGVNPLAITRAFFDNIFHLRRTSGASTITMQVARALERRPRTYRNKLIEIFRAFQLEIKYNKYEILQMYCNLLPFGGNIEGVKAAAYLYFQKDPDHLSLAEITALSIIPNRPSSLVPGKHNAEIRRQRDIWLHKFAAHGVFTGREIGDALSEPFAAKRTTFPRFAPHLANKLRRSHADYVTATLNLKIQAKTEEIIAAYCRSLRLKGITNAAAVVIDNASHEVIAYAGSAGFSDTMYNGQVDGAAAIRQPGSTLKPLLYAMCIDDGFMTPKSILADVNINYGGYAPENYDRTLSGWVTMEYALENSLNIPAVKALNAVGLEKFLTTLGRADFAQVQRDAKKLGLSTILGGCGASLLEITGLYSAFANGGVHHRPVYTTQAAAGRKQQLVSEAASFMITDILSKVNRPDFPLSWQSTENMPKIAWKTGTSYGRRDAWSIGYNKKYTIGIWAGNFNGERSAHLSGAEIATPLLLRLFNTLDYDTDQEWFNPPADCDLRIVCAESGLPPADHCTRKISDYYIPSISSASVCSHAREEIHSRDGKVSYCRFCMPSNGYRKKMMRVIPAEMRLWMDERGIAYEKSPPHNPGCEQVISAGKPVILSPASGSEYLISKSAPEPIQLNCRTAEDVSTVFWYIDNRFYRSSPANSPLYFVPVEGPVKVSCTDDRGRNRDVWITVKMTDL